MTNKLDDDAHESMNEGRGVSLLMSILAGLLFAVGLLGFLFFPGCATPPTTQQIDAFIESVTESEAYAKIYAEIEARVMAYEDAKKAEKPVAVEAGTTTPNAGAVDSAGDAVAFSSLQWQYGGMKAGGAVLSTPRLSNASCNGRVYYYKWDVGLSGWGLGNGDAGAICAVFIERDGKWIGGKFDWVSTSRALRELKHLESYSDWPSSGIKLPLRGKVAFVVVSANGKLRSNVILAEVK